MTFRQKRPIINTAERSLDDEAPIESLSARVESPGFRERDSQSVMAGNINFSRTHKKNLGLSMNALPYSFDSEAAETFWLKMQEDYQERRPLTPFEILAARETAVEQEAQEAEEHAQEIARYAQQTAAYAS